MDELGYALAGAASMWLFVMGIYQTVEVVVWLFNNLNWCMGTC